MVNVAKYTIHGYYGICRDGSPIFSFSIAFSGSCSWPVARIPKNGPLKGVLPSTLPENTIRRFFSRVLFRDFLHAVSVTGGSSTKEAKIKKKH